MAQVQYPLDGVDGRPNPLRSMSTSSESTARLISPAVPYATPPPAYIAQKPASDLIMSEISHNVIVSEPALTLVNDFLDQVLYNIISTSRSTALPALRATVPNVLKPRLGKAALKMAEEELNEYLNDEEEVEVGAKLGAIEPKQDFNADLVWKLVRLRCMVYTRLGDLEEEDEQEWLERERLLEQLDFAKRTAPHAEMEMGPASAIFLTSIIEYLGEQALYFAAQHAYKKHQKLVGSEQQNEIHSNDVIVVDGKDMSHVGRDSPLSRLWRSWRRNTREARPMSPGVLVSPVTPSLSLSRSSSAAVPARSVIDMRPPHDIPLPMTTKDVDEIEVPGLAPPISDEEEESAEEPQQKRKRPSSFTYIPEPVPVESLAVEVPEVPTRSPLRPTWIHARSISTPVPTLGKLQSSKTIIAQRDEALAKVYAQVTEASPAGDTGRAVATPVSLHISRDDQKTMNAMAITPPAGFAFAPTGAGLLSSRELAQSSAPPKKTVAEEILGLQPSVSPPTDAQTGASITNVSDFDSMYVPVATPSGSPPAQSTPVDRPISQTGGYLQRGQPVVDEVPTAVKGQEGAGRREQKLRPTSIQQQSLRKSSSNYPFEESGQRTPTLTGHDFAVLPARTSHLPDVESPVSAMTPAHSRPQSSASGLPATSAATGPAAVPADILPAGHATTDTRDVHEADSSRASSRSSRLIGVAKDGMGHISTVTQQRGISGTTNEPKDSLYPTDNNNHSKAIRHSTSNSSASRRVNGKQYPLGGENDEAKKKSLEILIRSNETLHYTLTPAAAMRDDPATVQRNRPHPHGRADSLSGSYSQGSDTAPSKTRLGGLSSNPPKSPVTPTTATGPAQRNMTPTSPQNAGATVSPLRTKKLVGEPRDARGERETATRDLADYARSTGPQDENQLPRAIGVRPHVVASEAPARTNSASNAQSASSTNTRTASKAKYEARDARPSRGAETSDLVEFLRDGPPTAAREHRIDRKVAPFRTTMDSEDFNALVDQHNTTLKKRSPNVQDREAVDAYSAIPSVSSQTPSVAPAGRAAKGVVVPAPDRQAYDDDNGMPKRTRRRIKDPYAIYDSDDDDFEEDLGGKQPKTQEESLIDFLRNTGPSASSVAQPILTDRASQRSPILTSSSARETSPHLTQTGSKMDKYRPTHPTHASHIQRNRSQPRYEARDAKATRANTAELAEYLKNSGPPPNSQYKPQPFILSSTPSTSRPQSKPIAKEDNGLFKMFSKRKK